MNFLIIQRSELKTQIRRCKKLLATLFLKVMNYCLIYSSSKRNEPIILVKYHKLKIWAYELFKHFIFPQIIKNQTKKLNVLLQL